MGKRVPEQFELSMNNFMSEMEPALDPPLPDMRGEKRAVRREVAQHTLLELHHLLPELIRVEPHRELTVRSLLIKLARRLLKRKLAALADGGGPGTGVY